MGQGMGGRWGVGGEERGVQVGGGEYKGWRGVRVMGGGCEGDGGCQWWANLDQAPEDLDKNIFRDLSPTPKP